MFRLVLLLLKQRLDFVVVHELPVHHQNLKDFCCETVENDKLGAIPVLPEALTQVQVLILFQIIYLDPQVFFCVKGIIGSSKCGC